MTAEFCQILEGKIGEERTFVHFVIKLLASKGAVCRFKKLDMTDDFAVAVEISWALKL